VRVGGALTDYQRGMAERLGVRDAIATLPHLDRPTLAAVYRRSCALLLPSDPEGFGWPGLGGMACGTPLVPSAALPPAPQAGGRPEGARERRGGDRFRAGGGRAGLDRGGRPPAAGPRRPPRMERPPPRRPRARRGLFARDVRRRHPPRLPPRAGDEAVTGGE